MKIVLGIACALATVWSAAEAEELRITTGGETGTYYPFGQQMSEVAREYGVDLQVEISQGSVLNLKRLLGYEGGDHGKFYQLAIVQADVLADLRREAEGSRTLRDLVNRIKVVMPLYNEEVHVFARQDRGLKSFDDLSGKKVEAGKPESGTYQTARFLYTLAGLRWSEGGDISDQGQRDAITLLQDDWTDAVFDVAGVPSKLGMDYVHEGDGIGLLEITNPDIYSGPNSPYTLVTIPEDTYPWLDEPVETAAVGSLLVAFGYEGAENCQAIADLTEAILTKLDWLREHRHRKWKQVQPFDALDRTDLYDCVRPVYEKLQANR